MLALRGMLQSFGSTHGCSMLQDSCSSSHCLWRCPGKLPSLAMAMGRHGQGPPWPRACWIGHRGGYQWAAQLDATHLEPGIHYEICIDLDGNLAYAMFTYVYICLQCLPLVSDLPLASLISCNLGNPDH